MSHQNQEPSVSSVAQNLSTSSAESAPRSLTDAVPPKGLLGVCQKMFGDSTETKLPSGRWVVVLVIACLVAMCVSGYLSWVALTSSKVAGCGGGRLFNCGHVISSRWSLWMGIPVSLLGFGLYAMMGTSLFFGVSSKFGSPVRHTAWALVTVLAISAGFAAIWFVSLQVFVLKHLCAYCLVAHTCGLATAGIALRQRAVSKRGTKLSIVLGLTGLGILIGGQLIGEVPKTYQIETFETPAASPDVFDFQAPGSSEPVPDETLFEAPGFDSTPASTSMKIPAPNSLFMFAASVVSPQLVFAGQVTTPQENSSAQSNQAQSNQVQSNQATAAEQKPQDAQATTPPARRFVMINGGTVKLDTAQWPLVGSPDAKYIFVEMYDYCCPHCRRTHLAIKGASDLLNGDLAVIALPIPLNSFCNGAVQRTDPKFAESCEISKLAVAVWRTDPSKFTEFHDWMFTGAEAPNYAKAKAHAESLVDTKKLGVELSSTTPAQYIAQCVKLYGLAGNGNVPKLMFPATSIVGEFTSSEGLVDIIKQQIK